jgi:hypothetical protein
MRTSHVRLSGSALQSRVAQFGQRSFVKSIQQVSKAMTATTGTVTINAVDVNNSIVLFDGTTAPSGASPTTCNCYVELTNSTTVTFTRSSNASNCTTKATIVEFYPGVVKSVQRGVITITGTTTSGTATITAVDTGKATLNMRGFTDNVGTVGDGWVSIVLTNATTVTANRGNGAAIGSVNSSISWEVVEYY